MSAIRRYGLLIAASLMYFGIYYVYDIPSALSTPLKSHLGITAHQYSYLVNSLYVAFAVPSIIMPILSGFAIQRYGVRPTLIYCLVTVLGGQLGFCVATQYKSSAGLIVSRVLLGLGAEVVGVLGNEGLTRWFPGDETALAMSIFISISSMGQVANSAITSYLTTAFGVLWTTWATSIGCLILVILTATFFWVMDDVRGSVNTKPPNYTESIRRLPNSFWYLALICLVGYGCLLPFFNSAQRFLGTKFYGDNQKSAGLAISIVHLENGVLPVLLGLLLEIPRLKNYSLALLFSCLLMIIPHGLFLTQYGEPIFSLCVLGVADALFVVALWASVPISILRSATQPATPKWKMTPLPPREVHASVRLVFENIDDDSSGEEDSDATGEALLRDDAEEYETKHNIMAESNEELVVIGYGILTSLFSLCIAVVPFFLAAAESLAGYTGLELVFISLASISSLICVLLVRNEKCLS